MPPDGRPPTMQMLYNSEHYAVVLIGTPPAESDQANGSETAASGPSRGGYEIVDKVLRREIYLDGELALSFRRQVDELVRREPTTEAVDEFLSGFAGMMSRPLTLH